MLSHLAVPVEFLSGLPQLKKLYQRIERLSDPGTFLRQSLAELHITSVFNPRDKLKIPSRGPCIVISNHLYCALEGIVLVEMLLGIRPDVKIMANFLIARIPQLRSLMISVDPFEGKNSVSANIRPVREALRWVREGGLLIIFPAGEVSQYRVSRRTVTDPPWKYSVVTVIRHAKTVIIPIYSRGRNSLTFQMLDLFILACACCFGRGSVVDEEAVAEAIQSGCLAGYTADVFETEDYSRQDRPLVIFPGLLDDHRIVFTAHHGSAVDDARRAIALDAAANIVEALAGKKPKGAVNHPQ